MADKIKDTGKSARRIVVKDKPKPLIDSMELAERLGADIVIEAPNFGGGPMGAMAAGQWIAERQRKERERNDMDSNRAGCSRGDHVRLWMKGLEMSISGRVNHFHAGNIIIDCVDGKTRKFGVEDIEKTMVFGDLLPPEQRPKFGRPMRKRKPYRDQSHRRHK
jgi:hypothetical protein